MIRLLKIKKCSCGKKHFTVPSNARFSDDTDFSGFWFECQCGSTLWVKPEMAREEKQLLEAVIEALEKKAS